MSSTAIESPQVTTERWTVDPSRTTVEFEVSPFWGLHVVRGRFGRFDGSYTVGPDGPQIELTIDAASIDTRNAARDRHLQASDFFGVAEFPLVRFTSTRILAAGTGRVHVSGTLFAAGTSVPVAFDASVRLVDGELEVEATSTVDQSRFGMSRGPLRHIRRPARMHVKARLASDRPA